VLCQKYIHLSDISGSKIPMLTWQVTTPLSKLDRPFSKKEGHKISVLRISLFPLMKNSFV
jgi:hypothetical protein